MAMMRTLVLYLVLLLAVATFATAQSNETIDEILQQDPATVGSAAYLALSAADLMHDDSTPEKAVEIAMEAGWLDPELTADSPATFGIAAHLLMQSFEVRGGLMYLIAAGPRYAAREFVYRQWVPDHHSPREVISGEFLLRMTGSFLDNQEVAQ